MTRGQHHLPQFLLKGFASRTSKKETFTWFFRKDSSPVESNIKNIAKVRDFYGAPFESDIEQRLSVMESAFAGLIRRLREGRGLEHRQLICEFVASTQIRTANLRSGVGEALEAFTSEFGSALTKQSNRDLLAEKAFAGAMEKIKGGALDYLLDTLPAHRRREVEASLGPKLREHLGTTVRDMTETMALQIRSLHEPQSFKVSQNKVLSENLLPEQRIGQLMELEWKVCVEEGGSLILGDVGVIAGTAAGELVNILSQEPPLHAIFLPISKTRLLIGSRAGEATPLFSVVNQASAELSREFFIGTGEESYSKLSSHIGSRARLFPQTEMEDIVSSSFIGLNPNSSE